MTTLKKVTRAITNVLCALALAYVAWCIILYSVQRDMLYHPPQDDFESCSDNRTLKEARVLTDISQQDSRVVLIYLHGNAESACQSQIWMRIAGSLDMAYAIPEYPGYGGDGRATSIAAVLKEMDIIAAQLENKTTIIVGRSIGNGPAAYLASKLQPQRLILISPYDELRSVVQARYIPGFLLKDNYQPQTYLEGYDGTTIIYAGEKDTTIPARISRRLDAEKFVIVTGAGHNDILDIAMDQVLRDIQGARD